MATRKRPPRQRPSLRQIASWALDEGQFYVLVAAVLILANARLFYGSLKLQTEHVSLWYVRDAFEQFTQGLRQPAWSAPLDDVFIHFDFARSAARGAPFEWTDGNGYSSGGTSLLYPFVLAVGYLAGFRDLTLAHWMGVVACVGTFGFLLASRRAFRALPPATALLAPPVILATGVLNWTLFSGMEVALFLALWGWSLVAWDNLIQAIEQDRATPLTSLGLGLACAFLVAGRPEAAPLVAVFGFWAAGALWSRGRHKGAAWSLLLVGVPGACVVIGHMVANHVLTGTSSAAGALAKLEMHHPYLTPEQVWGSWLFFLEYQFGRITHYHFTSIPGTGYVIWLFALLSLVFHKTRRFGAVVMVSVLFWSALVALNGQVRWQNERYAMPAVAWLLLAAALGAGATLDWAFSLERRTWQRWSTTGVVALSAALFVWGQSQRFREQVWFFGRASRNILEQHVRVGLYLGNARHPRPRRILLSDAGAIPYMADLPAFDLIGLGGYAGLPIARASRQGVGAAVELIEHMPPVDRPDIMALYPSWWGTFTLWFGQQVEQFPVRGNVICGGSSKIIYRPDWTPLEHSGEPFSLRPAERVIDSIDVADLLSEQAHDVWWDRPDQGYVDMKMLPDPRNHRRDLWDAGRLLSPGMGLHFRIGRELDLERAPALLVRVAPARDAQLSLEVPGKAPVRIQVAAQDDWQELRIPLGQDPGEFPITLRAEKEGLHLFHVFVVDGGRAEISDESP